MAIDIRKLSSKALRGYVKKYTPICNPKVGITLSSTECISWGNELRKLTSVRHKNTVLRIFHGDVYTKEKLFRFGLVDSNACPRCGEIEDLEHKLIRCNYVKRIWDLALRSTSKLKVINYPNQDRTKQVLDIGSTSQIVLTIHSEIMLRILSLKDSADYLIHPKSFVRLALQYVLKNERKMASKIYYWNTKSLISKNHKMITSWQRDLTPLENRKLLS